MINKITLSVDLYYWLKSLDATSLELQTKVPKLVKPTEKKTWLQNWRGLDWNYPWLSYHSSP